MIELLVQILLLIFAYLIGSISWAHIIALLTKKIDIREYGSKNMGATNAFRVLGAKWGLLVYFLDALKGACMVAVVKYNPFGFDFSDAIIIIHPIIYGVAAILGHLFPIFYGFKGGKGVSTASGIILAYIPWLWPVGVLIFTTSCLITRYVSVSSCITLSAGVIITLCLDPKDWWLIGLMIVADLFIIIKHIPNFKRIIKGTESYINLKAFKDKSQPAFIYKKKENQDNQDK